MCLVIDASTPTGWDEMHRIRPGLAGANPIISQTKRTIVKKLLLAITAGQQAGENFEGALKQCMMGPYHRYGRKERSEVV